MNSSAQPALESPRAVADKRPKRALLAAIRMALRVESAAVRHNTQTFNRGRYAATAALPDYDALKDRARAIKEHSIERLPGLVATLEDSVKRNGGHFFLAANAEEACRYVAGVCRNAGVKLVVKGKSMTSEEVGLNRALEKLGIEVAETDLAEFILQVADEQPSHNIAPAIHYSRERITALFKRVFRTDEPLDSGEALTRFARERLREKFLRADAGISGANLIAADSGTLVLVESEANIRMTSLVPPLHIAIAGIEKIIPSRQDLAPFIELLAASATGQPMSSYTTIFSPPLLGAPVLTDGVAQARQFHLVIVDNGRMKMRDDAVLREALYCIRCGACLNSCANFQTVGGHAFGGETYSGGIGGSWEAGTRSLEHARFSELCTGCSRCVPQCPVRIDIPWLNTVLRQQLGRQEAGKSSGLWAQAFGLPSGDRGVSLQKLFFGRFDLFGKIGSRLAWLANQLSRPSPSRALLEKLVGLDRRRTLPAFAGSTLVHASRRRMPRGTRETQARANVVLFADIFTNYNSPARGLAVLRVLESLGIDVTVSESLPDGRAPFSQGMIATAAEQAQRTAAHLARSIEEGSVIVVVEPSVLAMFRLDYRHLLDGSRGQALFEKLRVNCFDAGEYVWDFVQKNRLDTAAAFPAPIHPRGMRVFFHSHCQQKTIGCAAPNEALLRAAGFDVVTSQVECCGMAGSFGYKKEFYDLSMAVGEDLFAQVRRADENGKRTLVASGTSCIEQLHAGLARPVFHPMELLAEIVQKK
jgi:iron-sulfur cluster protein